MHIGFKRYINTLLLIYLIPAEKWRWEISLEGISIEWRPGNHVTILNMNLEWKQCSLLCDGVRHSRSFQWLHLCRVCTFQYSIAPQNKIQPEQNAKSQQTKELKKTHKHRSSIVLTYSMKFNSIEFNQLSKWHENVNAVEEHANERQLSHNSQGNFMVLFMFMCLFFRLIPKLDYILHFTKVVSGRLAPHLFGVSLFICFVCAHTSHCRLTHSKSTKWYKTLNFY